MTNLKFTDFKKLEGTKKMEKNLYIDASHPNETRIFLNRKIQLKNHPYL